MSRSDYYASPFGVAFSAYMERPPLSRLIARTFWGSDVRPYYESMAAVAQVPDGGTIVDCPCGAGPAFRGLAPGQQVRYPAAALREAGRILGPGGRLVGSTFVLGGSNRRGRLLVKAGRGDFGKPGTAADVMRWLGEAGFAEPEIQTSGSMHCFDARLR